MDLLKADQEISSLRKAFEDMRVEVDDRHHRLYEEAVQLAAKVGIQPSRSRTVQRQIHRRNLPASSVQQYYKTNLTIVFLDHSLQQIQLRFPPEAYICYTRFSIVPTILLANQPAKPVLIRFVNFMLKMFQMFLIFYRSWSQSL